MNAPIQTRLNGVERQASNTVGIVSSNGRYSAATSANWLAKQTGNNRREFAGLR